MTNDMQASSDEFNPAVAFCHQRIRTESLAAFGFRREKDAWIYVGPIMDGAFDCEVSIGDKATPPAVHVFDKATGDEYALWRMPGATGAFVGRIRKEVATILGRVVTDCCERAVFSSRQAHEIADLARRQWGEELEHLWERFPENAVLRRADTKKWYAAILRLKRSKLGFDSDEVVEIVDLRVTDGAASLGPLALPGYHMNKKNWFTVVLDGDVPTATLAELLTASRDRAK